MEYFFENINKVYQKLSQCSSNIDELYDRNTNFMKDLVLRCSYWTDVIRNDNQSNDQNLYNILNFIVVLIDLLTSHYEYYDTTIITKEITKISADLSNFLTQLKNIIYEKVPQIKVSLENYQILSKIFRRITYSKQNAMNTQTLGDLQRIMTSLMIDIRDTISKNIK